MQRIKISVMIFDAICTLSLVYACNDSNSCPVSKQVIGTQVITYKYNNKGDISTIQTIDTINNLHETYNFNWGNGKIIMSERGKVIQVYTLDEDQRISSYSTSGGNIQEYNFTYDFRGRLVKVKRKRFNEEKLISVSYFTVSYLKDNPVRIIDSCVISDISLKENPYVIRYRISYYDDVKNRSINSNIFPILISYLPAFNYVAYKESTGILPNKLIKSISYETNKEKYYQRNFSYDIDVKGNVREIKTSLDNKSHNSVNEVRKIAYQCY